MGSGFWRTGAKVNPCRLNSLSRYLVETTSASRRTNKDQLFVFSIFHDEERLTPCVILDFVVDIKTRRAGDFDIEALGEEK